MLNCTKQPPISKLYNCPDLSCKSSAFFCQTRFVIQMKANKWHAGLYVCHPQKTTASLNRHFEYTKNILAF